MVRMSHRRRRGMPARSSGFKPLGSRAFDDLSIFSACRKIVEHVALYCMDDALPVSVEQEILDTLYTLQYCCPSVLSISLGRISDATQYPQSLSGTSPYTHAQWVRFPSKAALEAYLKHPARNKAMEEQVQPFCHVSLSSYLHFSSLLDFLLKAKLVFHVSHPGPFNSRF